VIVDGHSVEELCKVLNQPRHQPLAIIANTIKGKGIPGEQIKRVPETPKSHLRAILGSSHTQVTPTGVLEPVYWQDGGKMFPPEQVVGADRSQV